MRIISKSVFCSLLALSIGNAVDAKAQSIVFNFTGSNQTYQVPSNVSNLQISLWGAGGGDLGGSGAYVSGLLAVTPGATLSIIVGSGGSFGFGGIPGGFGGGGGGGGTHDLLGGAGGGGTFIFSGSTLLVAAAGGGGGLHRTTNGGQAVGGAGGIEVGGDGNSPGDGLGGTQTAGGATTFGMAGSLYQGGNSSGGGGGGGYYGGGAGGNVGDIYLSGGGGSSFIDNLAQAITGAGGIGTAAGTLPGGTSDPNYIAGIGFGGRYAFPDDPTGNGGNGLLVIAAKQDAAAPEPSAISLLALPLTVSIIATKRSRRRRSQG